MNVILAFIDHIYGVNESTTAVNVRLEILRGIALGLRNLDNYIIRSLLFRIGGFRQIIQTTSAQQNTKTRKTMRGFLTTVCRRSGPSNNLF
ncbi:hypothetical protein CSQ87_09620 [Bifidobacterium simiarum]|uniref:Uncharacterized protein n=1 Tax=Bifidobacterium simiarum TaxID=2045441 RepID=A0A2M9HCJ5_9BIFI|nr:hypothetical protein CSQ87_09620 [Bifidobacterium simiarum]